MFKRNLLVLSLTASFAVAPHMALAYIGPGVGAGAFAAVLGVLGSIFLAIVAVLYYPIKRMMKRRKSKAAKKPGNSEPAE